MLHHTEPPRSCHTFPDSGWRSSDSSGVTRFTFLFSIYYFLPFFYKAKLWLFIMVYSWSDYAEATREGYCKAWYFSSIFLDYLHSLQTQIFPVFSICYSFLATMIRIYTVEFCLWSSKNEHIGILVQRVANLCFNYTWSVSLCMMFFGLGTVQVEFKDWWKDQFDADRGLPLTFNFFCVKLSWNMIKFVQATYG